MKMRGCGQKAVMDYASLVLAFLVTLTHAAEQETFPLGRHVCVQQRQATQPVPFRQTYHRAYYKQTMEMCDGFRLCSRLTVAYQTAYRTVFHMQIRTSVVQGCCPGWQQSSPSDSSCSEPVCSNPCQNGGQCVAPDICQCPEGWRGSHCEQDVDECAGQNECQQVCQNLPGSFECSCQDGFKIADDKVSCRICLSCLSEFKAMQTTIETLTYRVDELETEKDSLLSNLTSMTHQYEEMMEHMQAAQAATTTAPGMSSSDKPEYGQMNFGSSNIMHSFDRMASLSNQISLLEEKMADCTCEPR